MSKHPRGTSRERATQTVVQHLGDHRAGERGQVTLRDGRMFTRRPRLAHLGPICGEWIAPRCETSDGRDGGSCEDAFWRAIAGPCAAIPTGSALQAQGGRP